MVTIIPFQTQEKMTNTLFKPHDKYAILTAAKNFYTGFIGVPDFPRWHPILSGNFALYDWELLITGTLDFGKNSSLNTLDACAQRSVTTTLSQEIAMHKHRRNGKYREVAKIWPGTNEVLPEFNKAINRFAERTDNASLTTLVLFSHGEQTGIQMGDAWLSYTTLLNRLDTIKGKKAIFLYACHSGSLLPILSNHPTRKDYAAITSCGADTLSSNWNDRELDDYLFRHFSQGRKYSDLTLPAVTASHPQEPQMLRYFDTKLI